MLALLSPQSRTILASLLGSVPRPGHARIHTPNHRLYDGFHLCAYLGTYEHNWGRLAKCEGLEYLQPDWKLCTSPSPLHVCEEVQMRKRGPVNEINRRRCHDWLKHLTPPPTHTHLLGCCRCVTSCQPLPSSCQSPLTTRKPAPHPVPQITCGTLFLTRNPWFCARLRHTVSHSEAVRARIPFWFTRNVTSVEYLF